MTLTRLLLCAALGLPAGAAAQETRTFDESGAEVTIIKPEPSAGGDVEVQEPDAIVAAEPDEIGEAPTVDADDMVRLDDDFVVPGLNMPVHALDDYDLIDRDGEDIGEVEHVLGPDENTASAVAVEFDGPGWFFADGDVTRVVDISLFSIEGDKLIIDIIKEDGRSLPVYTD